MTADKTGSVKLRPVWERCWCWQYGRCLVDCPTADLPRPRFTSDAEWRDTALQAMGVRRD